MIAESVGEIVGMNLKMFGNKMTKYDEMDDNESNW